MEYTQQNNTNECAICVINSFFNHFYKKDIKQELLQNAKMCQFGMSIYDFEVLCGKYGMSCDSYSLTNDEFENLEQKNWAVALCENSQNHFVIFKKERNRVIVIDSSRGKYNTTIPEFLKFFSGIIIFIKKNQNDFDIKDNKIKLFKHINARYIAINIFLQAALLLFSIIGSLYLTKYFINMRLDNSLTTSIWICIFFLFIFFIEQLIKYLCQIIIFEQTKKNCLSLSNEILNNTNKDSDFFNKVDKKYYCIVNDIIKSIASFNSLTIINFVAVCISNLTILVIFSFLNVFYVLLGFISLATFLIVEFFKYKFDSKIQYKMLSCSVNSFENGNDIAKYISSNRNIYKYHKIASDFKSNWVNYFSYNKQRNDFHTQFNIFLSIFYKFLIMASVLFITFFLYSKDLIDILIFLSIFNIYWFNCPTFSSFFSQYFTYKKFVEIYMNMINLGNVRYGESFLNEKIITIKINDKKITNNFLLENKKNINSFLFNVNSDSIVINDINMSSLSKEWIENNILFFEKNSELVDELKSTLKNPIAFEYIKQNKYNFYENDAIVNIYLFCSNLENKILLLPKIWHQKQKTKLKNLVNEISTKNFVLFYD